MKQCSLCEECQGEEPTCDACVNAIQEMGVETCVDILENGVFSIARLPVACQGRMTRTSARPCTQQVKKMCKKVVKKSSESVLHSVSRTTATVVHLFAVIGISAMLYAMYAIASDKNEEFVPIQTSEEI